ncbi:MAG: sugar ABC transporter ATP-binding protein [Solirubrobacterales bacterium]
MDGSSKRTAIHIQVAGIEKRFGAVHALRGVDLDLRGGEIHALVGQNGAGKSTLIRVLTGALRGDAGTISLDGQRVTFRSPAEADAAGIAVVHQEPQLFPDLSVADNILPNHPGTRHIGPLRVRDRGRSRARAAKLLGELGIDLDPRRPTAGLVPTEWKLVEVARALSGDAPALVLDEPTAALDPGGARHVLDLLRRLRERGAAVLLVTHRLGEVLAVAQRVTALRDGRVTATLPTSELDLDKLVRLVSEGPLTPVVARAAVARTARAGQAASAEETLLAAESLPFTDPDRRAFEVRAGEVVALTGLLGAGAAAFGRALAGDERLGSGTVSIKGAPLRSGRRSEAASRGVGLLPEDRRRDGIVPALSIERNIALGSIAAISRPWWLSRPRIRAQAERFIRALDIRPTDPRTPVENLSGGNQQKVLVARWLASGARVLVTEEPTHGLDVGAKSEISGLLRRFADDGSCVVVISLDIAEYLGLPDRVGVFRAGELVAELPGTSPEGEITAVAVGMEGTAR